MQVEIIPCLQDNYSYIIVDENNNSACVVDPSESKPIIDFLKNKNINVTLRKSKGKDINAACGQLVNELK